MTVFNLLKKVSSCFNQLGIPYFVTGSVASMAYGEARYTNDIDIVADIKKEHIPGLLTCFPQEDYYISEESIKNAIYRRFQFNIIQPATGLKIDVMIKQKSEFDKSRFSRSYCFPMDDVNVNFASPEDVIIKKMEFYKEGGSEKHLRDITGVLKTSMDMIDLKYIQDWADTLFLADVWQAVQDRIK